MYKVICQKLNFFPLLPALLLLTAIFSGCKKEISTKADDEQILSEKNNSNDVKLKNFMQVNLVANNANYNAAFVDPTLKNAWGIAWSPGGTAWVNAQGGHVSELYNGQGVKAALTVNVPSPGGNEGGNPTGIIFNPVVTDFVIPSGNTTAPTRAVFIFVGVDGIVSGWNPSWGNHAFAKFNNVATSAYTGLAIANNGGSNFLYAADFRAGKIAVWDRTWAPVAMSFTDPNLPAGYSPFNIENVGVQLFVMYAKVGPDGRSLPGKGLGIVDVFTPAGVLVKRFADKDKLNSPWGVTMAAATFFPQEIEDDDDGDDDHHTPQAKILIGNFGDGKINVYSLTGKFLGQLKSNDHVISIDKLWAIGFTPTTSTIDQNRLYFAAGPNNEEDGLFGYLIKAPATADDDD
jgi:uncharacterized protein (TIGR03118 family)